MPVSPAPLITVNGGEPQNGLVPTNTIDGYGGRVIDLIFTGLYVYGIDGEPRPAMLEHLHTEDHRRFTVTLRRGWRFTDGSPVTAHSYVDAWNFGALSTNKQLRSQAFAPIQGYDLVAQDQPRARTLNGLRVVDDRTFTIELTEPNIDFVLALGSAPFKPLPQAFFAMPTEAFGQCPIGNGPYLMAGPTAWQHDRHIDLLANPYYSGPDAARNTGISIRFPRTIEDSYQDLLAGRLDVLDQIPDTALATWRDDLGERAMRKPAALNKSLAIPYHLPHFHGEEGRLRRAAISLAIDRHHLTTRLFHATRLPSQDFTAQSLPGFSAGLPGSDVLRHDPEAARELWARAEEIAPYRGTFEIAHNQDGAHDLWIDLMGRQIAGTLDIGVRAVAFPTFKQIRDRAVAKTLACAFRKGWRGGHPSQIDFLEPMFSSAGAANDTGYRNPDFDRALADAKRATDLAACHTLTARAQQILLADLPVIPLWDYVAVGGHGPDVRAEFKWNGLPDYPNITRRTAPAPRTHEDGVS
ncbi:ABC transporter substrate-binding protein [Streptomyces sp. NPDC006530]|uniref:peptide ABC transporter substrate-binding protein n=1 Tax=Streptomyces sp. NPDC006530 TaxID=3364750 RepID=UPI0036C40046